MFLILFAFCMNQLQKWKDDFLIYDMFNLIGGFLMVIYAILIKSYPFLILNLIWAIVSFRDIFTDIKKTKAFIGHKKK
jgi:hypothetical protein